MFRKIKWKLTILNSTVVALLFFVFSFVLYQFTVDELNRRVNEDLYDVVQKIHRQDILKTRPSDPRVGIVYYLKDGRILTTPNIETEDTSVFQVNEELKEFNDVKTEDGYWYRILTKQMNHPEVDYVQAIRNISSEHEQQELLQGVLIVGSILSCLISIGVGFGLAHYSFIPIQRSWNQQRRFTGDASHELRTPLAVIQGGVEQLLQEAEKPVLYHGETVRRMLKETRRMNRLISDLLLLARSDSDEVLLNKEEVNLSLVIMDIADYFEDVAMSMELEFNVICPEKVMVNADSERIKQLLINLLDNSMKYTEPGGKVDLRVSKSYGKVIIEVQDTGIGIGKEHHGKLFDRFYRVNSARTRQGKGGHGLGLSIVKWIVDSHGGEIEVKSVEGEGTTMTVRLPCL